MKKVFRFFAIAAIACGMTMAVSCNKDDNGENGGNGGNGGGGNTENLPTTIDENFNNGLPSTSGSLSTSLSLAKSVPISSVMVRTACFQLPILMR